MQPVVDVNKKYASVANSGEQGSTLAAAALLAKLIQPFASVTDTYVQPLSAGVMSPDGSIPRYSLAEMTADKVPGDKPLDLYIDVQPLNGGPVRPCNVGITIQELRNSPQNPATAIAQALGLASADTVLAGFTRAFYPQVEADFEARANAVVMSED